MTSASELFHSRRLRLGRNSHEFGLDSDDRSNRRHRSAANQTRRDRFDIDGCDRLPRTNHHPGQPPPSRSSRRSRPSQERGSSHPEEGGHQSSPGNVSHSESHSNDRENPRLNGNDRLPGTVLLARERLLQRLRGVTFSEIRRSNRISSGNHWDDVAIRDVIRLVQPGDWETEHSAITPLTNSSGLTQKRPPGLAPKGIKCLPIEVFHIQEENDEQILSRLLREYSICLESFLEEDELIRLSCGHRYHFCCLAPWLQTCGDCPYCRRRIDVKEN